MSDKQYKRAVEDYKTKQTAIQQYKSNKASQTEESEKIIGLKDLSPIPAKKYYATYRESEADADYWREVTRECSSLFDEYPVLHNLYARVEAFHGNVYTANTDGSQLRHPAGSIRLKIGGSVMSGQRGEIHECLTFLGYEKEDFPPIGSLIAQTREMIDKLTQVRNAKPIEDQYVGPVWIDMPVLLTNSFFDHLKSSRSGINQMQGTAKAENLNKRLFSTDITIKCTPLLKKYKNTPLLGSFETDIEGVTPKKELILVEKGVVKNLLRSRIPTLTGSQSTGNSYYSNNPYLLQARLNPGVVEISTSNGMVDADMKKQLIEAALNEGLSHAYIIRRLPNGSTNWYYKVNVENGNEELIGRASLSIDHSPNSLRRTLATSANTNVYNLEIYETVVSAISPASIIIEEMTINKSGEFNIMHSNHNASMLKH